MSQAERERRRQEDERRRAMQVAAARWNLAFSDQRASWRLRNDIANVLRAARHVG